MQLASGPSTFLRATREKRVHEQLSTCCLPRKISRDLGGLQFGLVVIKCASHQSNLVGMAAVCGDKAKTPTENCPVNAARSRLFGSLRWFGVGLWASVDRTRFACALWTTLCQQRPKHPARSFSYMNPRFCHLIRLQSSTVAFRTFSTRLLVRIAATRALWLPAFYNFAGSLLKNDPWLLASGFFMRCVWTLRPLKMCKIHCHEVFKITWET